MVYCNKEREGGREMTEAICGGVISKSMLLKAMKKDPYSYMMSYVLPDKQYQLYVKYLKKGNRKKAREIFNKYAQSQI
jgi:hypothetical protein